MRFESEFVVTVYTNDEQYVALEKRESKKKVTNRFTWFSSVPLSRGECGQIPLGRNNITS